MKLHTYKTAAAVLLCSPSKVQKLCLAGEIPILKVGNETRIIEEDLDRWIRSRRHYLGGGNCVDPTSSQAFPTTEATHAK